MSENSNTGGCCSPRSTTDFEIGLKTVHIDEIFSTERPSREEMADFCTKIHDDIFKHKGILDCLRAVSNDIEHPWLLYLLSSFEYELSSGNHLTGAMVCGLKRLIAIKAATLTELESNESNLKQSQSWHIPDFFGFFHELIILINAGENAGEVDTALDRVRDANVNGGAIRPHEDVWGKDVALFFSAVEMMHTAGIPIRNSIELTKEYSRLSDEIDVVLSELDSGATLAQALSRTNGKLANPKLVEIVDQGEQAEQLEKALYSIMDSDDLQRSGRNSI